MQATHELRRTMRVRSRTELFCRPFLLALVLVPCLQVRFARAAPASGLEAGAANVDISPQRLPVIVNGNFFAVNAEKVVDPLHARAIVLRDGQTTLALCVVDSCVIPAEICAQIKKLAQEKTGIAVNRIMVSATHTHSAPSLMRAHASEIDPYYPQQFTLQVASAIEQAWKNLGPAEAGWTVVDDHAHTFCRQWIYRSDRIKTDPFGEATVRANMHPGHENPDCVGPEGPIDPALTLLAIRCAEWSTGGGAGQLLHALLRRTCRVGRLLRPFRQHSRRAAQRSRSECSARGHHVAGHQRRPDVARLRQAARRSRSGQVCPRRGPGGDCRIARTFAIGRM